MKPTPAALAPLCVGLALCAIAASCAREPSQSRNSTSTSRGEAVDDEPMDVPPDTESLGAQEEGEPTDAPQVSDEEGARPSPSTSSAASNDDATAPICGAKVAFEPRAAAGLEVAVEVEGVRMLDAKHSLLVEESGELTVTTGATSCRSHVVVVVASDQKEPQATHWYSGDAASERRVAVESGSIVTFTFKPVDGACGNADAALRNLGEDGIRLDTFGC